MTIEHVVEPGEHISAIARRYGFHRFETVWDDPANAALRAERENPHVLQPGDVVAIPELEPHTSTRATMQRHRFVAPQSTLRLRVRLQAVDGQSRADVECTARVAGATQVITSDGDGQVEIEVPVDVRTVELEWEDERRTLQVGGLDPTSSPDGLRDRLAALGFPVGDGEPEVMALAIELFRFEAQLDVSDAVDGALESALEDQFGA